MTEWTKSCLIVISSFFGVVVLDILTAHKFATEEATTQSRVDNMVHVINAELVIDFQHFTAENYRVKFIGEYELASCGMSLVTWTQSSITLLL